MHNLTRITYGLLYLMLLSPVFSYFTLQLDLGLFAIYLRLFAIVLGVFYLFRFGNKLYFPKLAWFILIFSIYVFKNRPNVRPFSKRDMQLAVGIGHQAALTIQRMRLLERIRHEELITRLLERFLPPKQADYVMKEYLEHGTLPGLSEYNLTILAADICESTKMVERLGARRFSNVLNNYYQEITEVVFKHNGTIHKYNWA